MSSIYITGDCHGEFSRFDIFCKNNHTAKEDIMICLGDMGLNYYLNNNDKWNKRILQKLPLTFVIVQGNHEKYAKNIKSYQKIKLPNENFPNIKGVFYYESEYPNLLFAINGYTYIINNKKFLALGGAYSVDKYYRLRMGYSWFEDEQMSKQEKTTLINKINNCKSQKKVDYIISHTCPLKYEPVHLFLSNIDQSMVDKTTESFFDWIDDNIIYEHWFFGHYHNNEDTWNKGTMLFENIREVK